MAESELIHNEEANTAPEKAPENATSNADAVTAEPTEKAKEVEVEDKLKENAAADTNDDVELTTDQKEARALELYEAGSGKPTADGGREEQAEMLAEALGLMVELRGDEMHRDLGPYYKAYGKVLLLVEREEGDVLGKAATKIQNEEAKKDESAGDAAPNDADDADGEGGEATDEATDLEQAWEVLELARVIFDRDGNDRELADTLFLLGDVSQESENWEQAASDYTECREVLGRFSESHDDSLKQVNHMLAITYLYGLRNPEKAAEAYVEAAKVHELRIKMFKEKLDSTPEDKELAKSLKDEEEFLTETLEKVKNCKTLEKEEMKFMQEQMANKMGGGNPFAAVTASAGAPADMKGKGKGKMASIDEGTTSIGFGNEGTTTIGFGGAPAGESTTGFSTPTVTGPVNVLSVKKSGKRKAEDNTDESAKAQKTEEPKTETQQ